MQTPGELLAKRAAQSASNGFKSTLSGGGMAPVASTPTASASVVIDGAVSRLWLMGDAWAKGYYFGASEVQT